MIRASLIFWILASTGNVLAQEATRAGNGGYCVIVEVPPTDDRDRGQGRDELVARFGLDLQKLFPDAPKDHRIDLESLQVIRQDGGKAEYPEHAQRKSPGDRPFRFYDHRLLDEFPTWRRYASLERLGGRPMFDMKERLPFGHRVFAPAGGHFRGTLVWPHTEDGNAPSTYGIYFDLAPNSDSHPDLINRFSVTLNDGAGFPHSFTKRINIMAGRKPIRHPNPHGDENSYVALHDLDGDGDHDCLYGAHSGHIWLHENRGSDEKPEIDEAGYRLSLAGGVPIRVGEPPENKEPGFNFTDLQGARPKIAPGDFDRDGNVDLVIGDTYGRVRMFLHAGRDDKGQHLFAEPSLIFRSRSRLSVHAGDWDGDRAPDVFVITGQRVDLLRNAASPRSGRFEEPERLNLPPTIGGFYGVSPVDLNGDGDTDLIYHSSSRITCWVERSFLEHGYREAALIRTSAKK